MSFFFFACYKNNNNNAETFSKGEKRSFEGTLGQAYADPLEVLVGGPLKL